MDDNTLIEMLLYRGEGTTLDYKMQQYPHSSAAPEAKGELLKDVLAFANAWRDEDAYILIGVSDSGELVGLDEDLDDSRLQQFVSEKTNTPVHFSYRSLSFKGYRLGLYTIEARGRPVYLKKAYGRVLADTVYVRRGSSTAIAKPEEIAKMGADRAEKAQAHAPELTLQLVGLDDIPLDPVRFEYRNIVIAGQDDLPDLVEERSASGMYGIGRSFSMERINSDYYREFAQYLQQSEGLFGFRLRLSNSGTNFAADVRVYLTIPISEGFDLIEEGEILDRPKSRGGILDVVYKSPSITGFSRRGVSIMVERNFHVAVFSIGKIQSGETLTTDSVYLVRPSQKLQSVSVRILSDQLREPIEIDVPVTIARQDVLYDLDDLDRL